MKWTRVYKLLECFGSLSLVFLALLFASCATTTPLPSDSTSAPTEIPLLTAIGDVRHALLNWDLERMNKAAQLLQWAKPTDEIEAFYRDYWRGHSAVSYDPGSARSLHQPRHRGPV